MQTENDPDAPAKPKRKPRRTIAPGTIEIPPDWHPARDPGFRDLFRELLRRAAEREQGGE